MSFTNITDELVDLMEKVLSDIPKSIKGNKTASQRIRTNTIKLGKISKEWRRVSLDLEKEAPQKN